MKKGTLFKVLFPLIGIVVVIGMGVSLVAGILGAIAGGTGNSDCSTNVTSSATTSSVSSGDGSIDSFVNEHKEAYLLSWKAGGFLPSASITQTMIENGFNFTNPSGTSFWQAHNMGGVKTSSLDDFPVTLATYGSDSVDITGTKEGVNVGDGTGGAYTWFSSYDAGIVGKAEFMARQTLYTAAINNTNGTSTLEAIADGGWATDSTYKTKLVEMYQTLGTKYAWLDQEAIEKYGTAPYQETSTTTTTSGTSAATTVSSTTSSCSSSGSTGGASDGTGTVPSEATAWGYQPSSLPTSLSQYIIDPTKLGMTYASSSGWYNPGSDYLAGQCVNLTISLGNHIWGHTGSVSGNGKDQAAAWAAIFGNNVKTTAKKGAIFSTQNGGGGYGHTGIVCHVFADGSLLIVEQNTPLSGIDSFGQSYTWNYRIWTVSEQQADIASFAYPDNQEPNLGN